MSKYTTGEIAKLCGVTVRTVQYYDSRGILVPSELSEGGRRLYSESELRRMRIICFLREAGIPLASIGELLRESDPGSVITVLIEQQEESLRAQLDDCRGKLERLGGIRRELRKMDEMSVESIGDIACIMESRKKLRRLHAVMLLTGVPMGLLQLAGIALWIALGLWQVFAAYIVIAVPYGIWVSRYYFHRVGYICPQCHSVFRPGLRDAFWAKHTAALRRLSCPDCGYTGFCVEVYREKEGEEEKNA